MTRKRLAACLAAALVVVLTGGAVLIIREMFFAPKTITALFPTATAVYPGDEVRISGVLVGTIDSIQAEGTHTSLTLHIDRDVPIPAGAKAVIVAQNLIAARYVQLTPAYRNGGGPTMADGAVIPLDRTAVPVEWDEVKDQLTRLATDLGPTSGVSTPSMARFINSAADAMGGNGDKLRHTLAQLSGVARILADGSGNVVDIIKNLQTFVTALRDSNQQIVSFQDRLATLTSVLNDSRSDLDAALTDLSVAVGEVQRFIAGSRNQTSEQIQRLANITQNLVDHRIDLENVLHVAPNALANGYNIYNPETGSPLGAFVLNNFSDPVGFVCGGIGAIENVTAPETAKVCAQHLGPLLRLFNFNTVPIPMNPVLMKAPGPDDLVYTEPGLAPGGAGGSPASPDIPPAVSAYTGLADPAGPHAPDPLQAPPSPAGAPVPPTPQSVADMLMPAEAVAPPPPGNSLNGQPIPAVGTPQP